MSAPQAAAITACTACAAVGGAAAGGAFSSGETTLDSEQLNNEDNTEAPTTQETLPQPLTYTFLSQELASETGYTDEMIGKKYQNYLVGTYGTDNGNRRWWEDAFNKYKEAVKKSEIKNKLSTQFAEELIDKGFADKASGDTKALNKVCEVLFKKKHTETLSSSADADGKNKDNLWRYCSELREPPKTISENQEADYAIPNSGSDEAIGKIKKADLLSTKAEVNNKLWKWKQEEFFKKEKSNVSEKLFSDLRALEDQKSTLDLLKNKCEEAYKMKNDSSDEQGKVQATTVVKYCSLDGQ